MHPLTTLPKQFDVCREAQVTLVTGRVCQAQILILKIVFPFVLASCCNNLAIVPPKVIILASYKVNVCLNFLGNQFLIVFQEDAYLLDIGMCSYRRGCEYSVNGTRQPALLETIFLSVPLHYTSLQGQT